jgi:hypothetical protein
MAILLGPMADMFGSVEPVLDIGSAAAGLARFWRKER